MMKVARGASLQPFYGVGYQPCIEPAEHGDVSSASYIPEYPAASTPPAQAIEILHNASQRLCRAPKQHTNIFVELFFWNIDEEAKLASQRLGATFKKYGFSVTENELRSRICRSSASAISRTFAAARFKYIFHEDDTLVIMHYIGGAKDERDDGMLSDFHVV
jgi:hypothetical protein